MELLRAGLLKAQLSKLPRISKNFDFSFVTCNEVFCLYCFALCFESE